MSAKLRFEAASRAHVGHVRRRNEDAHYQGQWLYVVADGLGGHVAGDIASSAAIGAMKPYDQLVGAADLADVLGRAINDADEAIRRKVRDKPEPAGMGTTMVAILRNDDTAVLANIGDSRAYLMRNFTAEHSPLVQISEDHTYQHWPERTGSPPSGEAGPFLGRTQGRPVSRLNSLPLRSGDRILLCSDGLSSYVPEEFIRATLNSASGPSKIADSLIELALQQGGPDNVTVMIIDTDSPSGA